MIYPILLQHFINFFYRHPKSVIKRYRRFGGFINYQKMLAGRRLMEKAALHLAPGVSYADGAEVYFLTGKKYLYQTLFCIHSLVKVSSANFKFVLIDDGSFDYELLQIINRLLPGADVITQKMVKENLARFLPQQQFAVLHQKRRVYPHIKKLTDIHTIPGNNWKLVLDSDMLFWADPVNIMKWLKNPDKPLHMKDCQNSYGYSKQLMEKLSGSQVPDAVNVGVIGLNSAQINWTKLNEWVKTLEQEEGTSYYLEQALTAMLIGGAPAEVLPANEYIVNPDTSAIENYTGTLHHYVDLSKEGYFKKAWKAI